MLQDDLPPAQLRGMLKLKRAEIQSSIEEEETRLARVAALLGQIEQEESMSNYDVVIKRIAPLRVASLRGIIPTFNQQGALWGELEAYLALNRVAPAGPCLTLYHDAARIMTSMPKSASHRSRLARQRAHPGVRSARRRNNGLHRSPRPIQRAVAGVQRTDEMDRTERLSHLRTRS
jgi:hypothetical protein